MRERLNWRYLAVAAVVVAVYAATAANLWSGRDFRTSGPLSFHRPAITAALDGAVAPNVALDHCFPHRTSPAYKVVGGLVRGKPYYACYALSQSGAVQSAEVVDGEGLAVHDASVIKAGGAWRWIGVVKTPEEVVLGGVAVAVLFGFGLLYYARPRPGAPVGAATGWQQPWALWVLAFTGVGWLVIAPLKTVSGARKVRLAMQMVFAWAGFWMLVLFTDANDVHDTIGTAITALLAVALLAAVAAGRRWVAPEGFGAPEGGPAISVGAPAAAWPGAGPAATAPLAAPAGDRPPFRVEGPGSLPSFADVGGMDALKKELSDTFGLVLAFAGEADKYKVTWNGLLLYGPPGVGKTFVARATAGEFGLNLVQISVSDLVSAYRGESARNVRAAFATAAANVACVLFFDEFDSVAQARDDWPDDESRRTVNALLEALEEYRSVRDLIVVAATNNLDGLDHAVVRPGRFDRHVRVDLPDQAARRGVFATQLHGRPTGADVDLDELARRSAGLTPAAIAAAVNRAALAAFKATTTGGSIVELSMHDLVSALTSGGADRPTVEEWSWDKVVLPPTTRDELVELQNVIGDADRASAYGVEPPSGALLAGPPGTGKTTIAKVLAAQAHCSFYPVSAADILSKWVGQSEQNIQRLFRRARENAPSIVFIDELDALATKRGESGSGWADQLLNQLLAEIDGMSGQRGVFVLAATNRPDVLDPAILRGGRLSRTIEVPLPDAPARTAMLKLMTARMPLSGVDLDALASRTNGLSGADLHALCQQAALQAMVRARKDGAADSGPAAPAVTTDDFDAALAEREQSKTTAATAGDHTGGYA